MLLIVKPRITSLCCVPVFAFARFDKPERKRRSSSFGLSAIVREAKA